MKSGQKFSEEVRSRAVRLADEHRGEYSSLAAALQSIVPKFGCTPEALREWVNKVAVEAG